jgi:ammonia channel protein AmtB
MLWVINKITPVRVSEAHEIGLDEAMHGESAYLLDDDDAPAPALAPVS